MTLLLACCARLLQRMMLYTSGIIGLHDLSRTIRYEHDRTSVLLLLLVWHAPLGVHSAKCRHQSPEWTILSHSYRLIQ